MELIGMRKWKEKEIYRRKGTSRKAGMYRRRALGSWRENRRVKIIRKGKKDDRRKKEIKNTSTNKQNTPKIVKRKMPKTAAVSIKGDTKQGFSCRSPEKGKIANKDGRITN